MDQELLDWLDDPDDPSLRYRILRELRDRDEGDPAVRACRAESLTSPTVRKLFDSMHADGYWLQAHQKTGRKTGAGVEYGAFATTHFCLSYLAELGLDRSDPLVALAAERYLALQGDDGDWTEAGWYERLSCLIGYNVRTFVRLGYRDDPRLTRAVELLLATERNDGGYLCGIHDRRYKTRQAKSCIRGSVKALLAFAELPELYGHPRVGRLVRYFLGRGGIFKSTDAGVLVNTDMERPSYPITWRANAWEILYALARMGHGDDPRLNPAWRHLESLTDAHGRWVLTWSPHQCPWKLGKRGHANRWLTFYALAGMRLRARTGAIPGNEPRPRSSDV